MVDELISEVQEDEKRKKKHKLIMMVVVISTIALLIISFTTYFIISSGKTDPTTETSGKQTSSDLDEIINNSSQYTPEHVDGLSKLIGEGMSFEDWAKANASGGPAIGLKWESEDRTFTYSGDKITTELTLTNGDFKIEEGFCIALNGILQKSSIECDGEKTDYEYFPAMAVDANTKKTIRISFVPNTGDKGDKLQMSLVCMYMPSGKVDDNSNIKVLNVTGYRSMNMLGPLTLEMEADAEDPVEVSGNLSAAKASKLKNEFKNMHKYEDVVGNVFNDVFESSRVLLYNDYKRNFDFSEGEHRTDLIVKRSDNCRLNLVIYGKGGEKRICVMHNNEPVPVFDGKMYYDVDLTEGEQIDIPIDIDTRNIEKYSYITVYVWEKETKEADGDPIVFDIPYTLICED